MITNNGIESIKDNHMNQNDKIKGLFTKGIVGLVVVQFIVLFLFNITKSEVLLDFDSSLEFRHVVEMWKNHKIFIDDWYYVSSLEIDTAMFFAAPIYFLTSNISLSIGIAHGIFAALFILVILDIYKNLHRELWEACLAVLLVFTPYTIEASANNLDYTNMMFVAGGQYEFRVLTVLILINVLVCRNKKKQIAWTCLYFILLFWTSLSCGNFVLLMGVAPVVFFHIMEKIVSKDISFSKREIAIIIIGVVLAVLGIVIKQNSVAGTAIRNELTLIHATKFVENIQNCFAGVFLLIQGLCKQDGVSVLSINGIYILVKMGLVLLCFSLPLIACFKCDALKKEKALGYALCLMFVDFFVLMVTNTQYGSTIFESRYHIVWFVAILVFLPVFLNIIMDCLDNKYLHGMVLSGCIMAVIFLNLVGVKRLANMQNPYYETSLDIMQMAETYEKETVFIYEGQLEANMIRAINDDIDCFRIFKMEEGYRMDVLDFYTNVLEPGKIQEAHLLFITEENFISLPEEVRKEYLYIDKCDIYNVYKSECNPWTF